MSRRAKYIAAFAAAGLLVCGIANADLVANALKIVIKTDTGVPLTDSDPSGAIDNDGGYSLVGTDHLAGSVVTDVWCEITSNGTLTGGTVKVWKYTGSTWGRVPSLDFTIPNIGKAKWVGEAIAVAGAEGRIYCQPSSVTESSGDGGLTRAYGIRVEKR